MAALMRMLHERQYAIDTARATPYAALPAIDPNQSNASEMIMKIMIALFCTHDGAEHETTGLVQLRSLLRQPSRRISERVSAL